MFSVPCARGSGAAETGCRMERNDLHGCIMGDMAQAGDDSGLAGVVTTEAVRSDPSLDLFLKVMQKAFADGLDAGCDKKRKIKGDTKIFDISNWVSGIH